MTKEEKKKLEEAEVHHEEAMDLIEKSIMAKFRDNDEEKMKEFQYEAYLKAVQAANILRETFIEPSRAILFRSAASIAMLVGKYNEMMEMTRLGLLGNPPRWVADDLYAMRGEKEKMVGRVIGEPDEKDEAK